jgi:hypothetical protein
VSLLRSWEFWQRILLVLGPLLGFLSGWVSLRRGSSGEKTCQEASAQLVASMGKDPKQLTEFLKSSSRYPCLPDTMDPRGPKGK